MTELQRNIMTDRTKTICPLIFDLGGIQTNEFIILKYSKYSDKIE